MTDKAPVTHRNAVEHSRQLAIRINQILDGKINSVGTCTLNTSVGATTVVDIRTGNGSFISLMPTTSSAATELGTGNTYVSSRNAGQNFIITHTNNAQNDRTFTYVILG